MKGCSEFREDNETNDPNDIDYNDSYASCDEDMTISFPTDEQEEEEDDDDDDDDDDNDGEETTPANDDFYLYVLCDNETIMKVGAQVIIVKRTIYPNAYIHPCFTPIQREEKCPL